MVCAVTPPIAESQNAMIDSQPKANPKNNDRSESYKEGSLTLLGAVSMGTGVMIGVGIFALTGQVAELSREWFPFAFFGRGPVV